MATLVELNGGFKGWLGKSTEQKPSGDDLATGSMFIELDTGTTKYYDADSETWKTFGGGS